jgi:predicted DNA-binding ribbon-helix-helix protein
VPTTIWQFRKDRAVYAVLSSSLSARASGIPAANATLTATWIANERIVPSPVACAPAGVTHACPCPWAKDTPAGHTTHLTLPLRVIGMLTMVARMANNQREPARGSLPSLGVLWQNPEVLPSSSRAFASMAGPTSIALEQEFWDFLREIASERRVHIGRLVQSVLESKASGGGAQRAALVLRLSRGAENTY